MGLGCSLDLQHLCERLPPHAGPRILGADGTTVAVHHVEHPSAGEVRVVGDGDEVDPEPITGRLQPVPEIFRSGAGTGGRGRKKPLRRLGVGRSEHHAMHMPAAWAPCPLPPDERGEGARVVVSLGGVHVQRPRGRLELSCAPIPFDRSTASDRGVVRHHEEVEWPVETHPIPEARVDRGKPPRKAIGRVGIRVDVPRAKSIRRIGRMNVRIPPVQVPLLSHYGSGGSTHYKCERNQQPALSYSHHFVLL